MLKHTRRNVSVFLENLKLTFLLMLALQLISTRKLTKYVKVCDAETVYLIIIRPNCIMGVIIPQI